MSHPIYSNRLANEKSPYLLQHAHNPIDWYPWGEEAFAKAIELDRPIFLSIGYATCHWCHVMEQESFANFAIAELLNDTFVNIKVDREEKPEVDSLYMEFSQAMMAGGAGWPLNVILTPDRMPFFASTYLPPDSKHGFLGMKQLVVRIKEIWEDPEEREQVIQQAGKIVDLFANQVQTVGDTLPAKEQIHEAAELLFKTADPIYGGTKGSPKFPIGYQACFLLRNARATGESRSLFYVERTLDMMHRGGIYDHIGGGFSRYTVDEKWVFPHFEKMLYDNAILARAYLETWAFTRENFYAQVAHDIFNFVLREMHAESGGFYSAQDADTEEHEGLYYTWSWDEIHQALGPDAPLFSAYYGVTPTGNFEGRNILHETQSLQEFAEIHRIDPVLLSKKLETCRKHLFEIRNQRVHPITDDKIIASSNGLMIHALVEAGRLFSNEKYIAIGEKAARFIRENMWQQGTLFRRFRDGESRFDGCLDDYASMIHAAISLFEADKGAEWLDFALQLTHALTEEFKSENGAFYFTNGKDANLILRACEFYDGAEPSGNAIHAENLLRLYQITGIQEFKSYAEDILKAAKPHIDLYPPGACYHLMALQRYLDQDAATIIVSLNDAEEHRAEIAKMLAGRFSPHRVVIWRRGSDEELRDLVPLCRDKHPLDGKTTLYVCKQNRCEEPITQLPKMWDVL